VGFPIDASFSLRLLAIAALNLMLSADNGVVIALAVDAAPRSQRMRILVGGAVCSVAFQTAATFLAAELLAIKFMRLAGGIFIIWLSLKLCRRTYARNLRREAAHVSLWHTVWFVVLANFAMSTDNTLAVAGAAQGDVALLVAGLALSIPLVVFAGDLLARLMAGRPLVMNLGAALLAVIGVNMVMTDPSLVIFQTADLTRRTVEAGAAIAVLVIGTGARLRGTSAPTEPSNSPRDATSPKDVTWS
jgi:YjbE family integral membrane protein